MKIIADENILQAREAFGGFGDVVFLSGRVITNEVLSDADILLVRSITKVNESLLKGTKVKFVATATAGQLRPAPGNRKRIEPAGCDSFARGI